MALAPCSQDPILGFVPFAKPFHALAGRVYEVSASGAVLEVLDALATRHVVALIAVPVGLAKRAQVVLLLCLVLDGVHGEVELEVELHAERGDVFNRPLVVAFQKGAHQTPEVLQEDWVLVLKEQDVEHAFDALGHLEVLRVALEPDEDGRFVSPVVVEERILACRHLGKEALPHAVRVFVAASIRNSRAKE